MLPKPVQWHLLQAPLHILNLPNNRRAHKDQQRRANQLATSQQDIRISIIPVETLEQGNFPQPPYGGISSHDLLRTQLNNFLEAHDDQLWPLFSVTEEGRTEPFC